MTRLAPRFKMNRNGTATLSGIPAGFLRSLFVAASIHHYDTEKKHEASKAAVQAEAAASSYGDVILANYHDAGVWIRTMRMLIDSIADAPKYRHGYEDIPVTQLDQLGIFCRKRAVRQARESRERIAGLMDLIMASVEKRRAEKVAPQ